MEAEEKEVMRVSEDFFRKLEGVKNMPGMFVPQWRRRVIDERVKVNSCGKDPVELFRKMFPDGTWNPNESLYTVFKKTLKFRQGEKVDEILDAGLERWFTIFSGMVPLTLVYKEERKKKDYDVYDIIDKMPWEQYKLMKQDDYYDVVNDLLTLEERLDHYEHFMKQRQNKVPLMRQPYSDPLTFFGTYRYQTTLYEELFRQLEGMKLYIVGDGPGTASAAAIRCGLEYYSYEPNGIGSLARRLEIITSDKPRKAKDTDITFLGNVMDYDLAVETFSERILIVDESRKCMAELDMVELEDSEGKIWHTKNIYLELPRVKFLPVANCVHMLPEKVRPMDAKSSFFAKKNGFLVSEDGFPICTSPELNGFNILTRDWAYGKMFKSGMTKYVDGRVMTIFDSEHVYLKTDKFSVKYFEHYNSSSVVSYSICEIQPNGMFKISIKNPRRVRFIEFMEKKKVAVIPVSLYKDYGIFQLADYVERLARVKYKKK